MHILFIKLRANLISNNQTSSKVNIIPVLLGFGVYASQMTLISKNKISLEILVNALNY